MTPLQVLIVYASGVPTVFFWLLRSNSILYHWDRIDHEERVAKEGRQRVFGYDRQWHHWRIKSPEWRRNVIWRYAVVMSIFWPITMVFFIVKFIIGLIVKMRNILVKLPE